MSEKWIRNFLTGLLGIILLSISVGVAAQNPKQKNLPSVIRLSSHTLGSEGSVVAIAVSEALTNELQVPVKNIPFGNDVARLKSIINKESVAGLIATAAFIDATNSSGDFKGWDHRQYRNVWSGYPAYASIMVRGDSKIKTISDCRGKKAAYVPGWEGGRKTLASMLAFANISWDQVVHTPTGSYVKTLETVGDGGADFCLVSVTTPKVLELAASPVGIRVLPIEPHNDAQAWARFHKEAPHYVPFYCEIGVLKNSPTWIGATYYFWVTLDETNEDLIYTLAQGLHKTYPKFKDAASFGPGTGTQAVSLENTRNIDLWKAGPIPYHPGTIKYLKEINEWTSAHEEYQKKAIISEKEVQRASKGREKEKK
jgi:hypothetical protein